MNKPSLSAHCLASTRVLDQSQEEQEPENGGNEDACEAEESTEKGPLHEEQGIRIELEIRQRGRDQETHSQASGTESDSTSETSSDDGSTGSSHRLDVHNYTSCIQETQLSPDGTCIFTSDLNRSFSVYPVDTSIQAKDSPRPLKPYSQLTSSDPIWAFAANPHFDVNDANSTHVLISRRDRYITLHNALWDVNNPNPTTSPDKPVNIATPLTCYKLVNPLTEAVSAPLSLVYTHSGTHFFASHQNAIATFDLEHPSAPIHTIPTIPATRTKLKGGGRGFKGWITALSLSPPSTFASGGMLAAGARTRHVGIYDALSGQEVTTFELPRPTTRPTAPPRDALGDGVASLRHSPCGAYLYVAERMSDALLIYDVRNFRAALAYCACRTARTKQKLGFDVWGAGASVHDVGARAHEVWAGGTDGMVRVWRDPYLKEGAVQPDEVVQIGDGSMPVVGTMVHQSGSVLVAACGRLELEDDADAARGMGRRRGGQGKPKYREWGSLDIMGLT
ncbi:WD40-repeat-containing domain protein [Ampelomyces quisqualis]|uniref:WD40-repeat-containing domain protein n=1 Tax=Ampelomyces quisqualis TaxID=50730 RepID=A0A6A5Q8S8_AMPQU|nr:WD40-repeat-containing domain protein [Ampelomyces quisqualis]